MDYTQKIEDLVSDRQKFDHAVYTPIMKAVAELESRQDNKKIQEYCDKILQGNIPEIIKGRKSMVLFRHIATLNFEIRRFLIAADALEILHPVIFEYTADKFNDRNESKYYLGKIHFHRGTNKKREEMFEHKNIIDFNGSNNKPINTIKTKWDQLLVDFHHEIFARGFPHLKNSVFDLSDWLNVFGKDPKKYYKAFLCLFLKDAILFENFLLDEEHSFTKEVIMPIILEIEEEVGFKPLIVALEPTDIESDQFWYSHPYHEKEFLENKMNSKELL